MFNHALGPEFEPWWWQILFWTQAKRICFLLNSIWFIWYYYLSIKFVMLIAKQKIENKQNVFKKNLAYWKTWRLFDDVSFKTNRFCQLLFNILRLGKSFLSKSLPPIFARITKNVFKEKVFVLKLFFVLKDFLLFWR